MAIVVLKSGESLEGEVIAVGEPRVAVVSEGSVVELDACQVAEFRGAEPGLALPAGMRRATDYRRVFVDIEADGSATMHSNLQTIGSAEDVRASAEAFSESVPDVIEEDASEDDAWTWAIHFWSSPGMSIRYLDPFGLEHPVVEAGPRPGFKVSAIPPEEWTQPCDVSAYTIQLEVPISNEWPSSLQGTLIMSASGWSQQQEDGTWLFANWQGANGPGPEILEQYIRLPLGAEPLGEEPAGQWFEDRRGRRLCRWKSCVLLGDAFQYEVRYRCPSRAVG